MAKDQGAILWLILKNSTHLQIKKKLKKKKKRSSVRVILGLAVNTNLEIEQLDVKSNLIFGDINEEIYID